MSLKISYNTPLQLHLTNEHSTSLTHKFALRYLQKSPESLLIQAYHHFQVFTGIYKPTQCYIN